MPKIRIKKIEDTLTEVKKSGILNSNFKKQARSNESVSGKYFQTEYISLNEKSYLGDSYFNDNDTFVFEKNSKKSNLIGLPAIPLESDPNNFLLTTDSHFLLNNIVSLAEEESINRNHLTYNRLIQSPNKLDLSDDDLNSTGNFSSEILKEINQNHVVEVFTPFNDQYSSLYEGASNETILSTIDEEIKENYHIGNQKIINIELDFSNSVDGLLLNTLFATRSLDDTISLENLYDKKIFNSQYTFSLGESTNKFAVTSHFLPNMYWNEKNKRWEYNSQKDLIHVNSNLLSDNNIVFPNAITNNYSEDIDNIEIDATGEITNKHTLNFISNFIETSPITNIISNRKNFPSLLTNTYGFPYSEKWQPTEDHLINLNRYISREFLLEKVSIEGNVSLRSEYPTRTGNIFAEKSLSEEFFVNSLSSSEKEIVSGLNFYLLKSSEREQKKEYKYIQGYRKFNSTLLKYRELLDQENKIDKNLSDIKLKFDFDKLSGEVNQTSPREINDQLVSYEGIKSTLTKVVELKNNNQIQIANQNNFFFLDNQSENAIATYKSKNYTSSIDESENIDLANNTNSLYFFENNKNKLKGDYDLLFNTSKLFISKTPNSTLEVDSFTNADVETKEEIFIDIKEKDFKIFDSCTLPYSEDYVSESGFKAYSNLKEIETTEEVPFTASLELDLSYFDAIFGENVSEQDVINNLSNFGVTKDYFSSYSENDKVQFIIPDITIFDSSYANTGLNISFIPESFDDPTYNSSNEHYFAKRVKNIQSLQSDFYKYFIIVSEANSTVYLNMTALRNNKVVDLLVKFYSEEITVSDPAYVNLTSNLNDPEFLTSNSTFSYYKLSLIDKKRLFTSAIKLCLLLSPFERIAKIKETFVNNNFKFIFSFNTESSNPYNDINDKYLSNKTYYGNINTIEVATYNFVNLYTVFFKNLNEDDANSQNTKFISEQRPTAYSVIESAYLPSSVSEIFHEENISILEGKFENKLNSHFYKNLNEKNEIITDSGKSIESYSASKQKALHVLKPTDNIVFGVNSFHGFNTQSSFALLHKKINVKLYGREIKPIKKNESNYSSSIKKTFLGNNCLDIEIQGNRKTNNIAYKNTVENQIKTIDTIQPDPFVLSELIGKQFKNERKCVVDNILGKNVKKIILTDKVVDLVTDDIIADWHEKYYLNIHRNSIANSKKQFLKTKFRNDYFVYYDVEGISASYFTHKESLAFRRSVSDNITNIFNSYDVADVENADQYNKKELKLFVDQNNNDSLLNYSIRDFFVNSNFLIRDESNNIYESKYSGIKSNNFNEVKFLDLSYNIKQNNVDLYNTITLDLSNPERFSASLQYLKIPSYLSFNRYSLKSKNKDLEKFSINKTQETWCLVTQINGAKDFVDQKLLKLVMKKGRTNTLWGASSYVLLQDNNLANYYYENSFEMPLINMPFMAIYNENNNTFIIVTPIEKNYLLPLGESTSYESVSIFNVSNEYNSQENVSNSNFMFNLFELESDYQNFINNIINPDASILGSYEPKIDDGSENDYFIREGILTIIFPDFFLEGDDLGNKGIVYSNNENTIEKNSFIDKNYASLIDKKYIKDEGLFDLLSSKEFTESAAIDGSFLNQKIYQSRIYKKRGNNFIKTNIDIIYGIKNFKEVNLNIDSDDFKNINIIGIKSYNPITNRNTFHYLDNFSSINDKDTIRFYENTNEELFNTSKSLINKNYYELSLSDSTVSFNDSLSSVIEASAESVSLLTKNFLSYSSSKNYIFPGKPIASLSNNDEVNKCKLFFFGYRNSNEFKFPDDKIEGFRYGIMGHDSQSEKYEFNFKDSFGNFKDMSYYTKNYARVILKNNTLLEQYCVEKKYINEYYQRVDEETAKNSSTFTGSNTDVYSRHFYPFIESSDNSDLTYLYQA